MALTTQCPYCKTAFRVASDQLKLREGLVRCGACQEIFDGRAHLLADPDLTSSSPEEAHAPASAGDVEAPETGAGDSVDDLPAARPEAAVPVEAHRDSPFAVASSDGTRDADLTASTSTIETEAAASGPPYGRLDISADGKQDDTGETAGDADVTAATLLKAKAELTPMQPVAEPDDAEPMPSPKRETRRPAQVSVVTDPDEPEFLTQARRTEARSGSLQVALWSGSMLLFLSLLLQGAYSFRNTLAATYPPSRPLLEAYCKNLGCHLELLKQIDAVTIEASELQQSTTRQDSFVLTSLLRNRSTLPQTWPHIELSLNDANEKVIARRVFSAREYLSTSQDLAKGFAANSEQAVKLAFEARDLKPAGYRVYVFYP